MGLDYSARSENRIGIVGQVSGQRAIIAPLQRPEFAVGPGSTRDLVVWAWSLRNAARSTLRSVRTAGGGPAVEAKCQRLVDVTEALYQEAAVRGDFVYLYHHCNELSKLIPSLASASSSMGPVARFLGGEVRKLARLHEQAFAMLDFERRDNLDFEAHRADILRDCSASFLEGDDRHLGVPREVANLVGVLIVENGVRDGRYRLIDGWKMEVRGEAVWVLGPRL